MQTVKHVYRAKNKICVCAWWDEGGSLLFSYGNCNREQFPRVQKFFFIPISLVPS